MRIAVSALLLVLFVLSTPIIIGEEQRLVPDYFVSPSLAPVRYYNMNGDHGSITLSLYRENCTFDEYDSANNVYKYTYLYQMISNSYAGALSVVQGYPAIIFEERIKSRWTIHDVSGDVEFTGVPGATVFSLYHVGSTDELIAYIDIYGFSSAQSTGNAYFTFSIYFIHRRYNMSTGTYSDTILYQETRSGVEVPVPFDYIILDMTVIPVFYDWYNPDTGSHYLTFGFKGRWDAEIPQATIKGGEFEFAWHTYNVGPRSNITMDLVNSFVQDTRGWYVWVGVGLEYYRPQSSLYDLYPNHLGLSYGPTRTTSETPEQVMSEITVDGSIDISIPKITVYSYNVDVEKLYALFRYGGLEAYKYAYVKPGNVTRLGSDYTYTKTVILGLLPVGLGLMILGPFIFSGKIPGVDKILVILTAAIGVGIGIYGYQELLALILVFLSLFFIHRKSGEEGGEQE